MWLKSGRSSCGWGKSGSWRDRTPRPGGVRSCGFEGLGWYEAGGDWLSSDFEPSKGARRGREVGVFETHALKEADKEVRKWVVIALIKSDVLAMAESSPGNEDRHVVGGVFVRIPKVTAVDDGGVLEKGFSIFSGVFQAIKELAK